MAENAFKEGVNASWLNTRVEWRTQSLPGGPDTHRSGRSRPRFRLFVNSTTINVLITTHPVNCGPACFGRSNCPRQITLPLQQRLDPRETILKRPQINVCKQCVGAHAMAYILFHE